MPARRETILLTGATGYIGGLLLPRLQQADGHLRCLARRPQDLSAQISKGTEVLAGDVLDPASLAAAMAGVDTGYYLVHSMGASGDFRRARSSSRRQLRGCRAKRGGGPDHLSRRARVRRRPLGAPVQSPRGRTDPAQLWGRDDRTAGVDRDRLGERIVRGRARSRRAPARHSGAELEQDRRSADRGRGRHRVPRGRDGPQASSAARSTRSAAATGRATPRSCANTHACAISIGP